MTAIPFDIYNDTELEAWLEGNDHDFDPGAFREYVLYNGTHYFWTSVAQFEDAYQGQWADMESFAWDFYESTDVSGPVPPGFRLEVDIVAWECDYWISPNGHVFDRNV